jgi:PST family polysaccharide transporter
MGEEAAGYFQAAIGVSAMYVSFILQAMGTDFYPRLTAFAQDANTCNQLVNEQMEIALLLAAPLILAMLTFCPLVIYLLYSRNFGLASEILRWQMLGALLKVIAWPVGFILLAKNQGLKFFGCELLWNLAYLGTILLGLKPVGLIITGIGFTTAYALMLAWVLILGNWATGFRLNTINQKLVAVFVAAGVIIFLLSHFAPPAVHYALSTTLTLVCGWWALKKLYLVVGREKIASIWRTLTLK